MATLPSLPRVVAVALLTHKERRLGDPPVARPWLEAGRVTNVPSAIGGAAEVWATRQRLPIFRHFFTPEG